MESTPIIKHFRNKVLFLENKTGKEIEIEYNKLNTPDRFTLSSTPFRNTDGTYDFFIFYKQKED